MLIQASRLGVALQLGSLDALEEVTGDELLHFHEVVDGVGTFCCPVVKKKNKRKKKKGKKYITLHYIYTYINTHTHIYISTYMCMYMYICTVYT